MRAFLVAGRALRSFLSELTFLVGMSLVWFATGGVAVIAATLVGYPLAMMNGPWWLAPLLHHPDRAGYGCAGRRGPALRRRSAGDAHVLLGRPADLLAAGAGVERNWDGCPGAAADEHHLLRIPPQRFHAGVDADLGLSACVLVERSALPRIRSWCAWRSRERWAHCARLCSARWRIRFSQSFWC